MDGNGPQFFVAFNRTRGVKLADRVLRADDYESRSRGLLGRDSLDPAEGLWIVPCPMIHTFFMRFPIDVVFLTRDLKAARVLEGLKPWRLTPWVFSAHSVLELAGGVLKGSVAVGDQLEIH
ncbi:MAG: DUF192 domain-containing protein [Elusimicrobia bacterium]|nr:DUF192 domain-containing protein [Elusimicrobiota bacterium]